MDRYCLKYLGHTWNIFRYEMYAALHFTFTYLVLCTFSHLPLVREQVGQPGSLYWNPCFSWCPCVPTRAYSVVIYCSWKRRCIYFLIVLCHVNVSTRFVCHVLVVLIYALEYRQHAFAHRPEFIIIIHSSVLLLLVVFWRMALNYIAVLILLTKTKTKDLVD